MSSWTFERSILLNQQHIPLEKKSLSIIDPHDLGGSIEGLNLDEDLDVNLVSFAAAANVIWRGRSGHRKGRPKGTDGPRKVEPWRAAQCERRGR